jgi:beta-lactamase class A
MNTHLPSTPRRINLPILEVAGLLMILAAAMLFVTQLSQFSAERQTMPLGLTMGGVPVSGLPRTDAQARIEQIYGAPVKVMYRDQEIHLSPDQVGFRVNSEAMLSRANELRTEGTFWAGFWDYIWQRPEQAYSVDLVAEYSEDQLRAWLADVAARYDSPPTAASPSLSTLSFEAGQPGYTLNQEESFNRIDTALYKPTDRTVDLVIEQDPAPRPDMETLEALLVDYLVIRKFDGVASINVIDLQTGEELELDLDLREGGLTYLDCDVAYASTSTMKLPIMVEFFRYLDWTPTPGSDAYKILTETLWQSGNISANFIMQEIGFGDPFDGTKIITDSVQYLGLENSFIVAPYDNEDPPEYYSTPAREAARAGTCVDTYADPYMQTTTDDLAMLLDMIYQCAEFGGGDLLAVYPDDFTPDECRMMIDLLSNNEEGQWLVMSGVPADVPVAHKHGYTYDTHGDAAIVLSPGGDYVLAIFLWADVNWLDYSISSAIVENISAAVFNYFNPDLVLEPRRGPGIES